MSIGFTILLFLIFSPAYCGLFSTFVLYRLKRKVKGFNRFVFPIYACYLAMLPIWFCIGCFISLPTRNPVLAFIAFFAAFHVPIFQYHFVYNLTKTKGDKNFPLWYYLPAYLLFPILFFTQDDYLNQGAIIRFLLNVVYGILIFVRVRNYLRSVDREIYSDNTYSLKWLNTMVLITFGMTALSLFASLYNYAMGLQTFSLRIFLVISSVFICFQQIYVLVHTSRLSLTFLEDAKEVVQEENDDEPEESLLPDENVTFTSPISKDEFEALMLGKKLYLNPYLKMSDLVVSLQTNRDYLSKFVNQTYNMNFKSYINSLRMEEYKRLRADPSNSKYNIQELIFLAGFANYKQYLRTKGNNYTE